MNMFWFKYPLTVSICVQIVAGFSSSGSVGLVPAAYAQNRQGAAQPTPANAREVPARKIPTPETVNPQM
jgi:hypothetical protein